MPIEARTTWANSPYRKSEQRLVAPPAAAAPKGRPPDPPGLLLGELDTGGGIALDLARLLEGRLLAQGVSGAGKSWLIRRICEQAAGQVQLLVIDPEGEFATLSIELGILHVPGHKLDPAALRRLAHRCREHRTSLVLDLSDCDRTGQMIAVAPFLEGLVDAPKEHWHPCLVAIDEAHLFAPFGGHSTADTSVRKAAIGAVVDLMGRGRKRGLAGVLATQRLARLSKSVTSEISNFLVGLNAQDLDIRRAAEQIGWDARKAFDRLPTLAPGEFVAVGRAFSTQPAQLKVGGVRSEHKGATPAIAPAPRLDPGQASSLLDLEELVAQSAEDQGIVDEARQSRGTRAVRDFVRDPDFVVAAALFAALKAVRPEGVRSVDLAKHLRVTVDEIGRAVALLDAYGVLEFGAAGAAGPIAIDRKFLPSEKAPRVDSIVTGVAFPIGGDAPALPTESMRRERGYAPRLSVPYDPSKPRDARYWTEAELQVVRDNYGKPRGVDACRRLLPNRSVTVIYQKAQLLGLKAHGERGEHRRYVITPEIDETIRGRWPDLTARGATVAFAAELGLPKHVLLRAAERLGLTRQQRKEPPWTDAEKELLGKIPLHNLKSAARAFAEHGFNRTSTGIASMAKRLHIQRRYRETLSATSFASILGIDTKSVAVWCQNGTLTATRRDSQRLPQQGGAPWSITPDDARRFVLDQLASIDIRKVDKVAFVELLVSSGAEAEIAELTDALDRIVDSVSRSIAVLAHRQPRRRSRKSQELVNE